MCVVCVKKWKGRDARRIQENTARLADEVVDGERMKKEGETRRVVVVVA